MINIHVAGPEWFFGVDASLEAFAALTALLVAFAAYKIYRATKEKRYGFFAGIFVLLTLSFAARAIADAFLEEIFDVGKANLSAPSIFLAGYVTHIILALAAYIFLIVLTYRITDRRISTLFFLITIPGMLVSASYFLSFYGLGAILLAFVSIAYFQNYRKVGSAASLMVFISFLLLTLAQVQFILDIFKKILYVSAHITQAAGYLLLLVALLKILFKPQDLHEKVKTRHRV